MGQIGVRMNILWPKEIQWQTCSYRKRIFGVNPVLSVFRKRKRIFEIRFRLRVYLGKAQGLFNKSANEGVRSNLDR